MARLKEVIKSEDAAPKISGRKIPYSTKQGIIPAEQGILAQEQGISLAKTEIIAA